MNLEEFNQLEKKLLSINEQNEAAFIANIILKITQNSQKQWFLYGGHGGCMGPLSDTFVSKVVNELQQHNIKAIYGHSLECDVEDCDYLHSGFRIELMR